jgi:diguanylate cyclase
MGAGIAGTELVRAADVGPANWLALDSFGAFAQGGGEACLHRIASNEAHARALGDDATAWRCRDVMVSALASAGRMQEALTVAEDLMRYYKETGQSASRLQILGQTITARFARGDFTTALDELTDALAGLSQLRECNRASASAFLTVANAASAAELFEMAASQLRRAAELARKVAIPFLSRMVDAAVARNELRLAAGLELIGRPADATARYREALRAAIRAQAGEPTGHWRRIGRLYEGFAWTALGEPALGRIAMLEALGDDEAPLDHEDALIVRLGLARACAALGFADEGRAHLHKTAGRTDVTFSHVWQVAVVLEAAEVERAQHGDHPGIGIARYAAVVLANSLWEERERRLEAVMVRMQMLELAEENARFGHAVTEDALTQLGNRRRLDGALAELTETPPEAVSLLFLDLDNFKGINDVFSHAIGDQVLKTVADLLRRETRDGDVLVRYGGDEFVVVLRASELASAVRVGERIRAAVATYPWSRLAHGLTATISIGVADHRSAMTYDALMSAADTALHEAKDLGRDRVAVA